MKEETSMKCEICGKVGGSIVKLARKDNNYVDLYLICEHCKKAVR